MDSCFSWSWVCRGGARDLSWLTDTLEHSLEGATVVTLPEKIQLLQDLIEKLQSRVAAVKKSVSRPRKSILKCCMGYYRCELCEWSPSPRTKVTGLEEHYRTKHPGCAPRKGKKGEVWHLPNCNHLDIEICVAVPV
eukprot:COSAG05_NODE_530_length_8907_cov_8.972298_9_plen_136_part_00